MKLSNTYVIWLDEVWRWPLAGPVAVGGVFCLPWFSIEKYHRAKDITDSKKLNHLKREFLREQLLSCSDIIWATSFVSAKHIDRYGIVSSIRKASLDVINQIASKIDCLTKKDKDIEILLDGKTDYGIRKYIDYHLETIIKWDSSIREIWAASIIAKVERDYYMLDLSTKKKYQSYEFDRHKWYGTLLHRTAIAEYWLSDIHRKTFCRNIIT